MSVSAQGHVLGFMRPILLLALVLMGCQHTGSHAPYALARGGTPQEPDLRSSPEVTARLSRGELALADGRIGDAHDQFLSAVRVSAGDPRAVLGLAEAQLARGNHDRARQLLDQLDDRTSGVDAGRLYQARGIIALRSGLPEQARQLLERSVDSNASLWRAWIGLGRLHLTASRTQDARAAFVMAEQTAPQSASAQNDIGMAHLRMKNPETAMGYFKRALQIDPSHPLAQANLRIVKAMQGDYRGAVQGVDVERQHHAYNNAGYAALMRGEYEVADQYLRNAMVLSPIHHRTAAANLDLLPE